MILLAASGVVLYLRFHHVPFHVTSATITQRARSGCAVDVTGQIATNGSAGTVSYEWLFSSDRQPPRLRSASVTAGQHAVDAVLTVQGSGRGRSAETVTLRVLGPDRKSVTRHVVLRC